MIREIWRSYKAKKQFEMAQFQLADRLIREAANLVPSDSDDSDWTLIGGRGARLGMSRDLFTEEHRRMIQNRAYELYRTNEHSRSVIRNLERYIIGPRIAFTPLDDNPAVLKWWQEFENRNRFVLKQKEIVRRTFRDGECFIRFFEDPDSGRMTVRFLEAQHVQDPTRRYSHGIHTEFDDQPNGDVELVLGYVFSPDGTSLYEIPASDVMHIKVFSDSNEKRGNSIFELLGTSIEAYQRWLRDRMVLNRIRSFFGIHRKVSHATPGQVAALAAQSAAHRTSDRKGTNRQEPLKPGSIITTSDNVELVPIAANLQASDAQYDGRNILLTIAAGCGMAEFMVSGDASNANFASTMVAESPAVREFEDWQEFFGVFFREIFRRVIDAGVRSGQLPEGSVQVSVQDGKKTEQFKPTCLDVHLQFPPLVHREILQDARAYEIYLKSRIASRRSISTRAGFDFDVETEHMLREDNMDCSDADA